MIVSTDIVDTFLTEFRSCVPHDVEVANMLLHILPGILPPRLRHSPDALISKWDIKPAAKVLDLRCASGVLGLAALRAGAGSLLALDKNPQAVLTTKINIERLGYSNIGEVRYSETYSALKPGEKFDVILLAAAHADGRVNAAPDRRCFDEEYELMGAALSDAHLWLNAAGAMYIVCSDHGDIGRVLKLIKDSRLDVRALHFVRETFQKWRDQCIWDLGAVGTYLGPDLPDCDRR